MSRAWREGEGGVEKQIRASGLVDSLLRFFFVILVSVEVSVKAHDACLGAFLGQLEGILCKCPRLSADDGHRPDLLTTNRSLTAHRRNIKVRVWYAGRFHLHRK